MTKLMESFIADVPVETFQPGRLRPSVNERCYVYQVDRDRGIVMLQYRSAVPTTKRMKITLANGQPTRPKVTRYAYKIRNVYGTVNPNPKSSYAWVLETEHIHTTDPFSSAA